MKELLLYLTLLQLSGKGTLGYEMVALNIYAIAFIGFNYLIVLILYKKIFIKK